MWLVLLLACGTTTPEVPASPASEGASEAQGASLDVQTAFEPVWEAARRGDIAEADRLASSIVEAVEARPDAGFDRAIAHAEQAHLRATIGDIARAMSSLDTALALEPTTAADHEARLGFLALAVDILQFADQPEQAVPYARVALEERLALFPQADDPRRAVGHHALADALFASGQLAESREQARLALDLSRAEGGPLLCDTVLLLGLLQVAAGEAVSLPDVPLDPEALAQAVQPRLQGTGLETLLPVLSALVEAHPTERLHGARASVAWRTDALDLARDSASWLLEHGSPQGRLEAGAMLATLEEQRGDRAAAEAAYRRACDQAVGELKARCYRELGVFLSGDAARTEAARDALRAGAAANDPETRGRSLAALGILEAHEGTAEDARPLLEGALAALSPTHPDALFAASHLAALGTDHCGCDAPGGSFEETLLATAAAELPGVVESVALDGDGDVQLVLTRAVTADEQALLADLQERVIAEMRFRDQQVRGTSP